MRTRIVAYKPFGASLPALPDPLEVQLVTPMGELSTASVHYPRQGIGAASLDTAVELAFNYRNATDTAWVEPPNCRFLSMTSDFDHLEQTPTRKYNFISVGWMLRGAKVWEPAGLPVDEDGKVQFLSASAGRIMGTLIQNAKTRGWGAGLAVDFTPTMDSAGKPWAKIITLAYDLDLDLETVLSNLYQQGVCDYRWEGRTLRIFNPDTVMGRDKAAGPTPTRLLVADGQTAAPESWTNEDLVSNLAVLGEGGRRWEFPNTGTAPYGRLEKVVAQGGVSDPGTAALLAEAELVRGSGTRVSYTREFVVTEAMLAAPYRDYLPGDWVQGQRGIAFERLRTMSLSVTVTADGVKGHAVLGDRWEDLLLKLAKRTKGISGGASVGGSGVRPAPEGPDTKVPAAPTGLVVQPDAYLDNAGNARGQVSLSWAHPGKNTDGTLTGIDKFNVEYRVNELGKPWLMLTTTSDTTATYSPLNIFKANGTTPEQYGFRVQARGTNGRLSDYSTVTAVQMVTDTTPPPVPYFAAGDVTTWLRTVTVRWKGKGTLTGADQVSMPRDFSHINVWQAAAANMAGKVMVGQIRDVSIWQSGSMPLATVYYALSAVDRSGNESAISVARAITPTQRVDVQAIADKIDAAELQLVNVGEESLLTGAVIARHITASESMTAKMAQFLSVKAGQLDVNDIWADSVWVGAAKVGILTANSIKTTMLDSQIVTTGKLAANAVTAAKADIASLRAGILTADVIIGSMIYGTAIDGKTITGAIFQTDTAANKGIKLTKDWLIAYADGTSGVPAGDPAFFLSKQGNLTAQNGYFPGGTFIVGENNGNNIWIGSNMQSSGQPNASNRPGLVFYAGVTEDYSASVYRNGAWGALMLDSPYSSTGSYKGRSQISAANHGIKMWASKQGAITGPDNVGSEVLALNAADKDWYIGGGGTGNKDDFRIRSFGTYMTIRRNSGHQLEFRSDRSTILSTSTLDIAGNLYATSKNFKIRHPSKPGMDLLHGVTESPVAGIEYWGEATIGDDGEALVRLPDYFEALAKECNRAVYAAGNGAAVEWTTITDGEFTVTGTPGQCFTWLVKAERRGADFEIEQPTQPLEGDNIDA